MMKPIVSSLCVLMLLSYSAFAQELGNWSSAEVRLKQIENLNNADLWDMERMNEDLKPISERLPLHQGAFPVPAYSNLGPYKGGGAVSNQMARSLPQFSLKVGDKEVVFCSFHIGNSPFYEEANRNASFFTILTVIDTVDTNGFAIGAYNFLSRNHPDYGGEGSFSTKNNRVDFVAFTTPDKGSFAIVNMRLFHLEHGNIILIAPQNDGSFRSLQVKGSVPIDNACFEYLGTDVLKREEVVNFFSSEGVI